jgi:hypothetical protein
MAKESNGSTPYVFRPTLLVGIGGVGCRIAASVYEMAEQREMLTRCRLSILGFDTDAEDIAKLLASTGIPERNIIQTSRPMTVWATLLNNQEVLNDWFVPRECLATETRQMNLIKGACQIRMLSRLALYNCFKDNAIEGDLAQAVEKLNIHAQDTVRGQYKGTVNVLITGTLAGGTGSGMFLQTALYLRHFLQAMGCTPEIRGLFLLPDVIVHAFGINPREINSVRSNGYAALRELHAIFVETSNRTVIPVDFTYAPERSLKDDFIPFMNVTLIDYENQRGGVLGGDKTYIELAARAAYTLLLTPLGGTVDSREANQLKIMLAAADQGEVNRYSSIGISVIKYPTEEILEFLSLCQSLTILSEEWLYLDRLFRSHWLSYEQRKRAGLTSEEPPDRGLCYIRDLNQAADDHKPFFSDIRSSVHIIAKDKTGVERKDDRYETFLKAFMAEGLRVFWSRSHALVNLAKAKKETTGKKIKTLVELSESVHRGERNLSEWKTEIDDNLRAGPYEIFRSLLVLGETTKQKELKPHHLQTYLFSENANLVQVRYFLYELLQLIQDERTTLREETLKTKAKFESLGKKFDDPTTPKEQKVEDALHELAKLHKRSKLSLWYTRDVQDFWAKYSRFYNEMQDNLIKYAQEQVKEVLSRLLQDQVSDLVQVIEQFFDGLDALSAVLQDEKERNYRRHSPGQKSDSAHIYVYADERAKDDLLDRLGHTLLSSAAASALNKHLVQVLYERYKLEREATKWEKPEPFDSGGIFRSEVVDGFCRKTLEEKYGSIYRISVAEAIKREAGLRNLEFEPFLNGVADLGMTQSEALIRLTNPASGSRLVFWALSPDSARHIPQLRTAFKSDLGTSILEDPNFSKDELLCVTTLYCLSPGDLAKLAYGSSDDPYGAGAGQYYLTYRKVIDEILRDERTNPNSLKKGLTPHLDRRWHIPGAFPELTIKKTMEVISGLFDAFILALATRRFKQRKKGGKQAVYFEDWTRIGFPDALRFLVTPKDEMDILQAFIADHAAVQSTLECADDWLDRRLQEDGLTSGASIQDSAIFKGLLQPQTMLKASVCDYLLSFRGGFLTEKTKDLSLLERLYLKTQKIHEQAMTYSKPEEVINATISEISNQKNRLKEDSDFVKLSDDVRSLVMDLIENTLKRVQKTWQSLL